MMCAKYVKELDAIQAGGAFKAATKELLEKALVQGGSPQPEPERKLRRFRPRVLVLAACALLAVGIGAYALAGPFGFGSSAPLAQTTGEAKADAAADAGMDNVAGGAGMAEAPEAEMGIAEDDAAPAEPPAAPPPDGLDEYSTAGTADDGLAKLPVGELQGGGMGYEGYAAYSFAELATNAVWSPEGDWQPESLPVYQNTALAGEYQLVPEGEGYSMEEMRALAEETAAGLGVSITSFEEKTTPVGHADETGEKLITEELFYCLSAAFSGGEIEVDRSGSIHLTLDAGVTLGAPTAPAATTPREDHAGYLANMMQHFAPLLSYMESPTANLTMSRNIYGEAGWSYNVYDGASSREAALSNQSINRMVFYSDEAGQFAGAWLHRRDLSALVGEYTLISADEALQQVLDGKGLTTAPTPFPGEAAVAGIDLVYYATNFNEYFMPYYKIYAQLDRSQPGVAYDGSPEGLENYGVWYIPAIQGEYLDILPEAQIYFNGGAVP